MTLPLDAFFAALALAATGCGVAALAVAVARAAAGFVMEVAATPAAPDVPRRRLRVRLGRGLALALEFLLAAGVLRTAAAVSLEGVAMLAAIAAIRTAIARAVRRDAAWEARRQQEARAWG